MRSFGVWCIECASGRLGGSLCADCLYCPGLHSTSFFRDKGCDWWEGTLGHVQAETHGFRIGPLEIARDLGLRERFRGDVLLVSEVCEHDGGSDELEVNHACRGVIKDVAHSTIAEQAGAIRYFNASPRKQRKLRKRAKHRCAYCQAPLFRLREGVIFKTEEEYFNCLMIDAKFYEVSGHVCGNGHLILGLRGYRKNTPFYCAEEVKASGEGLYFQTSELFKEVCCTFGPRDGDGVVEVAFWKDLDAFDVSKKLKRLAHLNKDDSSCEAQRKETRGAASLRKPRAMSELQWELHDLKLRISKVARDFEDRCEEGSEFSEKEGLEDFNVDSESDLEARLEAGLDSEAGHQADEKYQYPFWEEAGWIYVGIVSVFVKDMPQARRIITSVLRNRDQKARTAFNAMQCLKRLMLRKVQVQSALDLLKRRRKDIEAALERAGIPACLSSQYGKWPDSDVVDRYVHVSLSTDTIFNP